MSRSSLSYLMASWTFYKLIKACLVSKFCHLFLDWMGLVDVILCSLRLVKDRIKPLNPSFSSESLLNIKLFAIPKSSFPNMNVDSRKHHVVYWWLLLTLNNTHLLMDICWTSLRICSIDILVCTVFDICLIVHYTSMCGRWEFWCHFQLDFQYILRGFCPLQWPIFWPKPQFTVD